VATPKCFGTNHEKTEMIKYKKVFKFRTDDSYEKALYDLYNITSDWGIHGHILQTVESGRVVTITNKELVVMHTDEKSTIRSFAMNLASIQSFMLAFLIKHQQIFLDAPNSDHREFAKYIATNTASIQVPLSIEGER
jgi:hypothetical protein